MTVEELIGLMDDESYFQFQSIYGYKRGYEVDISITKKNDITYCYFKTIADRKVVKIKAIAINTFYVLYSWEENQENGTDKN